jgi:hypothetical protein
MIDLQPEGINTVWIFYQAYLVILLVSGNIGGGGGGGGMETIGKIRQIEVTENSLFY